MTITSPPVHPRAAAGSILLGMAVVGCIDNAIAVLARDIGLWQFYLMRAVIACPAIWLLSRTGLGSLRPRRLWAVSLRGGTVAVGMVFYFGALAFIPLPQALAGLFTAPIFVLVLTALALREPVGPRRIAAVLVGFLGVLLVIEPWGAVLQIAAIMPVFAGLLYALGAIATRTICAGEPVLAMLLALFVVQGLIGLIGLWVFAGEQANFIAAGWIWPISGTTWALLFVQAWGSILGVGLLFRAYTLGEASYVAVFEYSVFLFGAFFAWLFFGQVLSLSGVAGIVLVSAAGIMIVSATRER